MKKRLLSLLLASIMVVSVCACGNGNGPAASTETRVAVENYVPTYPIVEEPITIKALVVGRDTTVSETRLVWDQVAELTGINIEWENIDGDAFSTRLASNNWPDLIAHDMGQTALYDYGVLGGRLVNYLDYLDVMPNLKKTLEDYPLTLAYATQLDGKVYNLFRVSGVQPTATTCRPHYRKDVLAAAGVTEAPETIEEFYDALVACREYYGEPSFIYEKNINSGYLQSVFGAFGDLTQLDWSDDGTGTIVYAPLTEQYKLYLEFLHKLYDEDLMHKEYLTLESNAVLNLVKGGKIAFFPPSPASSLLEEDLSGDWANLGTLKPFTSQYDDTPELCAYADYNTTHGMQINAASPYVEEICKMLDICFASEEVVEGSNLYGINFTTGPEFDTWVDNGDGTYSEVCPEGYSSRSTYINQVYHWGDNVGRNDAIANLITSTPGNSQQRQIGYMENIIPYMNDTVVSYKHLKFTDDEQYTMGNTYGEIQAYVEQATAEFISGARDLADWDAYVKQVESMGIAEATATVQASYDRFLAAAATATNME